jgi:hypothetical protein
MNDPGRSNLGRNACEYKIGEVMRGEVALAFGWTSAVITAGFVIIRIDPLK